ncbi:MAG: nucleotidyltransferase family protein, partial [Planctomycetota bacterium]
MRVDGIGPPIESPVESPIEPPIGPLIGPLIGARVARALLRELGGWGRAVRAARAEGLAPLLGCAAKAGLVRPPGELADRLADKGLRTLARLRAGAVAAAARAASGALADAGVRHAVIKGAALAGLYGDRSLRPCCDVDVLVEEATAPRASAALEAAGYHERARGAVEAAFAPPRGEILGVAIDLHFALAHRGQFTPDV